MLHLEIVNRDAFRSLISEVPKPISDANCHLHEFAARSSLLTPRSPSRHVDSNGVLLLRFLLCLSPSSSTSGPPAVAARLLVLVPDSLRNAW